jgi:hypothetical protein
MKLSKSINTGNLVIPAGTEIKFSTEGIGYFRGQKIEKDLIPVAALESSSIQDKFNLSSDLTKAIGMKVELVDDNPKNQMYIIADLPLDPDTFDFGRTKRGKALKSKILESLKFSEDTRNRIFITQASSDRRQYAYINVQRKDFK